MENKFVKIPPQKEAKLKSSKKEKSTSVKSKNNLRFTQFINGEFLTREYVLNNLNFIFFIIFLLLLTLAKGYYGKQLTQDVKETQNELNTLTAESVEAKAKLVEKTQRQVLVEKLNERGLKETVNPTKVIRIKKQTNER